MHSSTRARSRKIELERDIPQEEHFLKLVEIGEKERWLSQGFMTLPAREDSGFLGDAVFFPFLLTGLLQDLMFPPLLPSPVLLFFTLSFPLPISASLPHPCWFTDLSFPNIPPFYVKPFIELSCFLALVRECLHRHSNST